MSEENSSLFRQQVIDEFNSKLNGEVILKSDFSARFLGIVMLWLIFSAFAIGLIKIDLSQKITGNLAYDQHKNLIASFLISPDLAENFYPEKVISISLENISSHTPVVVPIKITHINNRLTVLESSKTLVSVTAVVQASFVHINDKEFKLNEGIGFSFSINNQKITLMNWIKQRYFAGDTYGN